MNLFERFAKMGEFLGMGLYEEENRSLFYRKSLGLRRYYEKKELPVYRGEMLYPSGTVERNRNTLIYDSYLYGLSWDEERIRQIDPEMAQRLKNDFMRYTPGVSPEHAVAGNMWNHAMPHYERILKEGFSAYQARIEKMQDREMREGLTHLLAGIACYVDRCVAYLESMQADERLINALKKVPFAPAESFYEAIVCWNFIFYLDGCDNLGCVADGLNPYYHGEKNALSLLENLFANIDETGGWSMALHAPYNELTKLCLQAVKGRRRPMTELFVDENTPDAIWDLAFDAVLSGCGQPAFYHPELILNGLKRRFPEIQEEDLKRFCGGGCTETMLAGLSNVGSVDAGINLPLILTQSVKKHLPGAASFEDFYQAFLTDVRAIADQTMDQIAASQKQRAKFNPLPMRTLLIDDCIDQGVEYNAGGARYMWSIVNFAGMTNIIDSMLVIQDWVYQTKKYSGAEMAALLESNDEAFLQETRKYPGCFGKDLDEANDMAHQVTSDIYSMLENRKPHLGLGYLPASIQFNTAATAGKDVGATPDGRRKGETLAESLGAIFNRDVLGPTALLKSVASMDLKKALGTPVVNLTVRPDFDRNIFKALILGFMKLGGLQLQITCVDEKMLLAAYEKPEDYPQLIVRVGGFSEYFCRLSDDLRRNIVQRTLHQLH